MMVGMTMMAVMTMVMMVVVVMVGAKKAFYVSISFSEVPRQLCRQEEQQVCEQVSLS